MKPNGKPCQRYAVKYGDGRCSPCGGRCLIAGPPCCCRCGFQHNIHLHHIIALIDGGTDSPENIARLCVGCHQEWHAVHECIFTWENFLQTPAPVFMGFIYREYARLFAESKAPQWSWLDVLFQWDVFRHDRFREAEEAANPDGLENEAQS